MKLPMPPIAILLIAGLALRLLLAYVLLPDSGHLGDMRYYSRWITALVSVGPGDFYAKTAANYPPGYLYIFWLIGVVSRAIASVTGGDAQHIAVELIKIPPIFLDVGGGFLAYRIIKLWSGESSVCDRTARVAAAIYLFNPALIYDSAIWGQTDAAGAFVMLLGVLALLAGPPEIAACVAVISGLLKPQFGVVLAPIIGTVLLKRYLVRFQRWEALLTKHYWMSQNGPVRLLSSAAVGMGVFYLLALPFNQGLRTFFYHMAETAGDYNILSMNAFNPWALMGTDKPSIVFGGVENYSSDDIPLLGSVTGVMIGTVVLIAGFALGVARLIRRSDLWSITLVGAYLSLCFFILPTRVHERYLLPAFAFFALLAALDPKWLWATVVLAIGSLINLHAVLSNIGTRNVAQLPLGEFFRSPTGILTSIVLQTAVFIFCALSLFSKPAPLPLKTCQALFPVQR